MNPAQQEKIIAKYRDCLAVIGQAAEDALKAAVFKADFPEDFEPSLSTVFLHICEIAMIHQAEAEAE